MIEKRVVLSQIEVQPDGTIQVRLEKQVVEDDVVLSREYHRTVITPLTKVDSQFAAVNSHLAEMGWPPVDQAAVARLRKIAGVEHTPGVKKMHRERIEAADKAQREEEERQAAILAEQQAVT